jgi:ABC-type glycerol-3-phosphate transport system substrate-binding protein
MYLTTKVFLLRVVTVCSVVVFLFLTACTPTITEAPAGVSSETSEGERETTGSALEASIGKPSAAELEGTLRVSAPPWIFKKFPLEEVATRFEADHPGVTVDLTRVDKWNAPTYITAWKSGHTPVDVYIGGTGSMLGPVIAGGWLEPMDDMLTGHMAKDKFISSFLAAGHYKRPDGEGTYYPVVPFMGEVAIIGVNTEALQKAGLWAGDAPVLISSWDEEEFFNWFSKLVPQSPTGAHVQIWDREFMQYNYCASIIAMTGTCLEEDGQGFDVTSDAARMWLGYIQKMNEQGVGKWTVTFEDGMSKWKTGAAGSLFAAQGHIMELVSVTEDEADIAYFGWPGAEENGSVLWTHAVWIPKVSPNKELGRAFIREQIFSPYFQQWGFNNYGKLPVLKEYYGEGITWFQDQIPTILAVADASKPIPLFEDMQIYLDVLVKYLPEAAFGRMSVDETLQAIQEESKNLDFTNLRAQ